MSLPLNSASAPAVEPRTSDCFATFFDHWLGEQDRDLQSLISAAEASSDSQHSVSEAERRTSPLVQRVLSHYENYYRVKAASADRDVLPMFAPTWRTSTESPFLWVGGWRPTMAIHLLYSKSGLQVESQLNQILCGNPTGDLADLSASQLQRIDRLQRQTIQHEREISEQAADVQETIADPQLVELSQAITEGSEVPGGVLAMESEIDGKQDAMQGVLGHADQLRLDTLKELVEILRPMQAVHFLIAAAELHLRVHEFGKAKDEVRRQP